MQSVPKTIPGGDANRRIKVLIVDDSALVRRLLTEMLSSDPSITVLGTANDAYDAREKIKALNPDVLTLDVEMPRMDGITFLRNLMRLRPMPVIMVSSLTDKGAEVTLDALSIGAVDYLPKPKIDLAATLADYKEELIAKVKAAASSRVRASSTTASASADAIHAKRDPQRQLRTTERIIAIGASTGGTEAIKEVLIRMPPDTPGIVITQHIPKLFSGAFARRMDACCQVSVCEAEDGQQILRGHAYIAPGDMHLLVVRDGARYVCRLDEGPPVNRHKPSVDVLFRSVAQQAGRNAIGVILTGMGKDGALGLKEMRDAGSRTIAQDEATSIVWGMPGEAVAVDAAADVLPLDNIWSRVLQLADEMDITRSGETGVIQTLQ
ncbi:MAG: two-component system, chemotaxis family, protein-glutamate methylesterase/glutaminase [Gammaproteobacteria bacterium]|jgi:two-component system chemotaxis response regulator CheB|nr:two-component system, chemotaxis family, protein-glutamate methylesterase/glutaminase [Gammaproteobacteria bacterium]